MRIRLAVAALVVALQSSVAFAGKPTDDVNVVNTAANPVPVQQQGTANVAITNQPTVAVSSLPAVTLSGTPSVAIAGTPTVTISGGLPAAPPPQIWSPSVHVSIPSGQLSGNNSFHVPPGKIFIIETISVSSTMPEANGFASIGVSGNGANAYPIALKANPFGSSVTQAVKFYAESNSDVVCQIYNTLPGGGGDANCNFTGTLVNAQ